MVFIDSSIYVQVSQKNAINLRVMFRVFGRQLQFIFFSTWSKLPSQLEKLMNSCLYKGIFASLNFMNILNKLKIKSVSLGENMKVSLLKTIFEFNLDN